MISNESFMLEISKQQEVRGERQFVVLIIGDKVISLIDNEFSYLLPDKGE